MIKNIFFTALFFLAVNISAFAQNDAKAKSLLSEVSKKFRAYNMVEADFTYTYNNRQSNHKESATGKLYLKSKENKYKIIVSGQELISDGVNQWTYLKQDNEVQVSEVDNSSTALNPSQIFTIYEKGFKYVLTGEEKLQGKTYSNIELAPLTARSFSKIKLKIDKSSKQVHSMSVYEKNGNIYTYLVKSLKPIQAKTDSFFSFDKTKYPGVEVVDLR